MILNPTLSGGDGAALQEYNTFRAFSAEITKGKTGFVALYFYGTFHILIDFSIGTSLVNTVIMYNSATEYTVISGKQMDALIIMRGDEQVCFLTDTSGESEPEIAKGYTLRYVTFV